MEYLCLVDERQIQLLKCQLRIRTGLARKGKLPVAVRIQRHERQRCEHIVRRHKSLCLDSRAPQRTGQEFSECVRSHLTEHPSLSAEFGDRSKEVCRGSTRMRGH